MKPLRVGSAVIICIAIATCGRNGRTGPPASPLTPVPTWATDGASQEAISGFWLRAASGAGDVCVYGESLSGSRVNLVWPRGYSLAGSPLRIVDADAHTVALVGKWIGVAGGGFAGSRTACAGPEGWLVASVTEVGDQPSTNG